MSPAQRGGADAALYIGVDCGGTSLRLAAADGDGRVEAETSTPTGDAAEREDGLGEAILAAVGEMASALRARGRTIGGVGVGLPFVCYGGKVWLNRNVDALDPGGLEAALAVAAGAPAELLNDVKCAALGEAWLGAARGAKDFVFANVGTGLSSAIFSGGRLVMGAHNAAGEIGYWLTGHPEDEAALRDGLGPLEEASGGVGISCSYARAAGPRGGGDGDPGAEAVFRLARGGDERARAVVDRALARLSVGLANLATLADPELLVLGGGVSAGLRDYADELVELVGRAAPFPPRVVFSSLGGRAGLVGAVRLGIAAGAGQEV